MRSDSRSRCESVRTKREQPPALERKCEIRDHVPRHRRRNRRGRLVFRSEEHERAVPDDWVKAGHGEQLREPLQHRVVESEQEDRHAKSDPMTATCTT